MQFFKPDTGVSMKSKELVVIFSNGKISIFCNGHELTKKWGGYTSVLVARTESSPHLWIDSTKALWKCTHASKNHIKCRGEFFSIPMAMEWEISLTDDGIIYWNVSMELKEPYHFERREANIMISEKYTRWEAGEVSYAGSGFKG